MSTESTDNSKLRELTHRFASLQAAHRALARSVHPSELDPIRKQSRALLVKLQSLSTQLQEQGPVTSSQSETSEPVTIDSVARALGQQAERTLVVLTGLGLAQLRATIPTLAKEHPDEVCGLIDVLLSGPLEDDKQLRALEYLITMLSADERGGRRVLVQEPSRATPRLHALAKIRLAGDEQVGASVRVLEDAAAQVFKEDEIGDIRDEVREFKESLGSDILHPRVLAAAVAYNVAMWNRVAAEIDSSRSIDELAEGLFVPSSELPTTESDAAPKEHILGSAAYEKLMQVVRARVMDEPVADPMGDAVASALSLEALRPGDAEAFESDESVESVWLMRAAITLDLALKQQSKLEGPLEMLGLDIDRLAEECIDELSDRMTARARKLMAENQFADAFRLSDVKTHSLAAHAAERAARARKLGGPGEFVSDDATPTAPSSGPLSVVSQLLRSLASAKGLIGLAIAGSVYMLVLGGPGGDPSAQQQQSTESRAQAINPFLEWGRHTEGEVPSRYVGRVGPAWVWLGTPERREVVTQIGQHFAELGTLRVVLTDATGQIVARFVNGEIVDVQPR